MRREFKAPPKKIIKVRKISMEQLKKCEEQNILVIITGGKK